MATHSYDLIDDKHGFWLLKRDDGKWTVVSYSESKSQVYDAMPGDRPQGGGHWFARATDAGIDYVSSGYSETYARKVFNTLIREYAD